MLIILFTNAITNATLPTQYEWVQLSSLNLKNAQTISFKVFPFVKKSFPNHWHYFSCRLNLTIFADLRHSKQAIWWGHCYSSSVLMVIRVSVWRVLSLSGATWDISQANYWTHTKWSQWGNIQTRQNIWSTLHELASTTISLWEKTAGKLKLRFLLLFRSSAAGHISNFSTDCDIALSSLIGEWEDRAH